MKSFKKRYLLFIPLLLVFIGLLGPKVSFDPITLSKDNFSLPIDQLDQFLANRAAKVNKLKPENESRIIWADSVRKTEYSICLLYTSPSPRDRG